MNFNKAVEIVRESLGDKRFDHTMRVVDEAEKLAHKYGESVERVKLAAVFHDYAKEFPVQELKSYIQSSDLPKDLLDFHFELWHGPVGAMLFNKKFGVQDLDIINAIRYHTTGRAGMSHLEKIIYVADYIEPGRNFPGLTEVREAAERDLDFACWLVSRNTLQHLLRKEATLYPESVLAYNAFTKKLKMEE